MTYGTSYFVSRAAAIRYYRDYEGSTEASAIAVDRKLAEGEIHIGKPPVMKGEKLRGPIGTGGYIREGLHQIDGGTRWAITMPEEAR